MKNNIKMYEKGSIEILHADSSHSFPLHSHECFCFGVVKGGRVHFKIGEQEKLLSKGMTYLIPSNVGVIISAAERYSYTTICLKNEIKDYLMQFHYTGYFPQTGADAQIGALCANFINGGSPEIFLKEIFRYLQMEADEKRPADAENREIELVEKGKKYIRDHVYEKFSLDDLAGYVHVSKYHFIRLFKKHTGVTPNQYYIQAKLYIAKKELKRNEKETDVAVDLNFADQSYLCNLFKKQMGISMKDFRNNIKVI